MLHLNETVSITHKYLSEFRLNIGIHFQVLIWDLHWVMDGLEWQI